MIRFEQVSVTYEGAPGPALRDVDVTVPEGELCLLVGPSGVGKSTLLNSVCGLVPHFTGGTLRGRVTVAGRDTRTHRPRELADVVGTVGQDPLAHFVTDTVEDELAYGMESLGLPSATMRRRVEETLDLLGLNELRDRPIATLSGGQRQRVAIGSVLTPHPAVLVLDEPTSALDPGAAEEVLAVLQRLVHDLGTTVLMAEHRLERVVQYADQVLLLPAPGAAARLGDPARLMGVSPVRPPVVALGRLAGWSPLPLSVRDARRAAGGLRERLARLAQQDGSARQDGVALQEERHEDGTLQEGQREDGTPQEERHEDGATLQEEARPARPRPRLLPRPLPRLRRYGRPAAHADSPYAGAGSPADELHGRVLARAEGLTLRRGRRTALHSVDLTIRTGETVALMGRNGAGKSTLLNSLVGVHAPTSGTVSVGAGADRLAPSRTKPALLLRHVGLVPQEPRDLLYAATVGAECETADADAGAAPGSCAALVATLLPHVPHGTHPRDLSEGQRLALALAVVLTARPPLLLLDEPTRGLDYAAKSRLVRVLHGLAAQGHATVLATHDVELAAEVAHRVVIIAQGEVVADGEAAEVVTSSPAYAPQVAKVLAPRRDVLTVTQVRTALREDEDEDRGRDRDRNGNGNEDGDTGAELEP